MPWPPPVSASLMEVVPADSQRIRNPGVDTRDVFYLPAVPSLVS